MDDEELVQTVIRAFLDDIPKQIETLKACLETDDAPTSERQAHTIKGAAATVGGEALRKVAEDMERAAREGDLDLVAALEPDLDERFNQLGEALHHFKGN